MVELHLWPDVITQSTGESYTMDYIRTEADGQLTIRLRHRLFGINCSITMVVFSLLIHLWIFHGYYWGALF